MTSTRQTELLTRFARIVSADGFARGLQPVQWQALMFLGSANRFSRTATGLTAWLEQTKGSVSQTITALEKKGLVIRQTDPDDHRVIRLTVTTQGRELLATPPPPLAAQMLDHLAAEDRAEFCRMVETMLRGRIAEQRRPFGECRRCARFEHSASGDHRCTLLEVALTEEDSGHLCIEHHAA